jgi:carboxyl-terminal processing protease
MSEIAAGREQAGKNMPFSHKTKGWLISAFLGASLLTGCAHTGPLIMENPAPELPATQDPVQKAEPEQPQDYGKKFSQEDYDNYVSMQFMDLIRILKRIRYLHSDGDLAADIIKMKVAAINGVLRELDPHSHYYSAEEFNASLEKRSGHSVGIGIEPIPHGKSIKIASLIKDGPAERAGLRVDDLITHVNNIPVPQLGHDGAVKEIRGAEAGTPVTLKIMRGNAKGSLDITVMREEVERPPVNSTRIGKDIGYVSLAHFGYTKTGSDGKVITDKTGTPVEDGLTAVHDAILALKKDMGPDIKAYILDLRGNPGGYLYQAVGIADLFLEAGKVVVTTHSRHPDANKVNVTETPEDITDGKPLIVLVNGGSVSASEILAGALQDHHRAIIIGSQTFGKGSVQAVLKQQSGEALKITFASYHTPNGYAVQGNGITPDIEVVTGKEKRTLRESDLPHTLKDTGIPRERTAPQATCSPSGKEIPVRKLDEILTTVDGKPDFTLLCAVEYARGKSAYTVVKPAARLIP